MLCAAAQLLAVAHLCLARHTICPQHGELVDALVPMQVEPARAELVEPSAPGVQRAATLLQVGADDHCALAQLLRGQGTAQPLLVPPLPRGLVGIAPVAVGAPTTRLRLWRVAPKQSPPV